MTSLHQKKIIIGNKDLTFLPALTRHDLIQGNRSTAPPTSHRFYTRSKARAMADENAPRFEQMEQTTQELKEMLLKNHEEHREQMASLMKIVLQMTRGKTTTEGSALMEVATGSGIIQEEPLCPLDSTSTHMQPSQGMCPLPNITPPPAQTT